MFYCDPCAIAKGWPQTFLRSHGKCEVCGTAAECSSMRSSDLPRPRPVTPGYSGYCVTPDGRHQYPLCSHACCPRCGQRASWSGVGVGSTCSGEHPDIHQLIRELGLEIHDDG